MPEDFDPERNEFTRSPNPESVIVPKAYFVVDALVGHKKQGGWAEYFKNFDMETLVSKGLATAGINTSTRLEYVPGSLDVKITHNYGSDRQMRTVTVEEPLDKGPGCNLESALGRNLDNLKFFQVLLGTNDDAKTISSIMTPSGITSYACGLDRKKEPNRIVSVRGSWLGFDNAPKNYGNALCIVYAKEASK
jgi:hypothetical protein